MSKYRHFVSGFFANREEAESALSRLVEHGLPRARLQLFDTASAPPAKAHHAGSQEVLRDVLKDGAVGAIVGTALGGLAELALVAGSVSLFIASPLVAPLAMLGNL